MMDGNKNSGEVYGSVDSTPTSSVKQVQLSTQSNPNLDINANRKNKLPLYCLCCPTKILNENVGFHIKHEQKLPKMSQKKDFVEVEYDVVEDTFQVKDIFQFENVGFSHPVDQIKYLTCSECEMGPIGWQEIPTSAIYVAISRVRCISDEDV